MNDDSLAKRALAVPPGHSTGPVGAAVNDPIPAWVNGALVPVDKMEVHRRGLRHKAVSVFVTDNGRILIQRRAPGKYHTPGLWANACCTHPRWGEKPGDCARRRLAEELGITGLKLTSRDRVEYRADVGGGLTEHEIVNLFTGEGRPQISPDPEEVSETRWLTLDALRGEVAAEPGRFTPWLRIYLARHADQIFGMAV